MSTGIIILIVTLVLLALMIALIIKQAFFSPIEWPKGKKIKASYKDYTVYFIYGKGADKYFINKPEKVADLCAKAAWALGTTWTEKRASGTPTAGIIKTSVVHVLDDEDYYNAYDKQYKQFNLKSNGTLREMEISRKKSIAISGCRASAFRTTETDGNLVIHELIHHILKYHNSTHNVPGHGDLYHAAEGFWHGTGEDALEIKAHKLFLSVKDEN